MQIKNFFWRRATRATIGITLTYLMLSLCEWSFVTSTWHGFSVFMLGLVGILCIWHTVDI